MKCCKPLYFLYGWMPVMAVLLTATALWLAHDLQTAPPTKDGGQAAETAATANPGEPAPSDKESQASAAEEPTLSFFTTICFIMTLGALGAHIQAIISFADYVGNQQFKESWTFFYVKRPFVGATISLLTFSVLRGGFVDGGSIPNAGKGIWGTVAIGLMAGLFSRQAMDKIAEVFGVIFSGKKVHRDDSLDITAELKTPVMEEADPGEIQRGKTTDLKIHGSNFHKTTEVHWGDTKLKCEWVSGSELKVSLPPALTKDVSVAELALTATNPKAKTPKSKPLTIPITA